LIYNRNQEITNGFIVAIIDILVHELAYGMLENNSHDIGAEIVNGLLDGSIEYTEHDDGLGGYKYHGEQFDPNELDQENNVNVRIDQGGEVDVIEDDPNFGLTHHRFERPGEDLRDFE